MRMKTKSFLIAMLMVIGVAAARAQTVTIEKKGSSLFKIIYADEIAAKVKISIFNESRDQMYSETFNGIKNLVRPISFMDVSQGEYTIEFQTRNGTKTEKINYVIEPTHKYAQLTKLPSDSRYMLAVTNEGLEKISIRIFDSANQLVLEESKDSNNGFAQVYNLKNLKGSFTFEVSDESGNTKTIRK